MFISRMSRGPTTHPQQQSTTALPVLLPDLLPRLDRLFLSHSLLLPPLLPSLCYRTCSRSCPVPHHSACSRSCYGSSCFCYLYINNTPSAFVYSQHPREGNKNILCSSLSAPTSLGNVKSKEFCKKLKEKKPFNLIALVFDQRR